MTENYVFETGTIATHNGEITIENPATGEHRTFNIRTQPDDARFAPGKRVVSLLTGRSNDNPFDYSGFGFVLDNGTIRVWRKKSGGVFDTYARMLATPERFVERGLVYRFAGKCRVCNRKLTTPESVDSGIGPVCAEKIGARREPSTTELKRADVRGVGISPAYPKRPAMTVDAVAESPAGWRAPNGGDRIVELVDGVDYDLGATTGRYNATADVFSMGNCFVPRSETVYAETVAPSDDGVLIDLRDSPAFWRLFG